MKVSESLCQFVEDSATRIRLTRKNSGTCRLLFRSFPLQAGPWLVARGLPHALVVVVSNGLSPGRAQAHVVNTRLGLDRSVLEKTLSDCLLHSEEFPAHVFPDIQLRQVQQRNGVLMSTATGQRVRPQLSVCNRAMSSTPAYHDQDVFGREEPMHAVIHTTVQCMEVLGFQNELGGPWISTNVFPMAPVVVGIIELSAVNRPYGTIFAQSRISVLETANTLVVVLLHVKFFMRSPELMTTMRRPGGLLKFASPQLTTSVSA